MKYQASKKNVQLIFENADDALLLMNDDGQICHANAAACEMFRRNNHEMTSLSWEALLTAAETETQKDHEMTLKIGQAKSDLTFIRNDGTIFEGLFNTVRFSSSDNAHFTLLVIHDMTKFMESESQLKNTEALGVQTVTHDDLTGLLNQYGFMDFMKHELEHAKRTGTPTGLILMDIDQFKQINERYGHGGGDFLLKEMSDYVRNHLREYDILARLSGDKFILLLPETAWEKCFVIAERLRLALETHDTIYLENTIRITVSLGVVGIPSHYEYSMDELFAILNSALNTAKSTRNTVFYLPRSFHNNIL